MTIRALLAMAAAVSAPGCHRSRWADLRVDAVARVDGRAVHASTIWQTRVVDEPLSEVSSRAEVRGAALAIPVSPGRYAYGLFMMIDGHSIDHGTSLDSIPEAVLGDEEQRHGGLHWPSSSAQIRDYVVEHMLGREIAICQPPVQRRDPHADCPVFVYFADPSDLESIRMIRPNETADIGGPSVVIERVGVGYVKPGGRSGSSQAALPPALREQDRPRLGKLPPGLETEAGRQLYKQDFVRK